MFNQQKLARMIAEKVREIATKQGNIPFKTGDLRKSIIVRKSSNGAIVGSNLPYARAVHDGRPAITIRPKKSGGRLRFKVRGSWVSAKSVRQPARKGRPFLRNAVTQLEREGGLEFLRPQLEAQAGKTLADALINEGFTVGRP